MTTFGRAFLFATRSLVRQPGRASVGILGIAAVGALLFDMLLLSRGLVVSFRDLLGSAGFDVRVTATDTPSINGFRVTNATAIAQQIAALPEVAEALPIRITDAETSVPSNAPNTSRSVFFDLLGINRPAWSLIEGSDLRVASGGGRRQLVVNRRLASALGVSLGAVVSVRVTCVTDRAALKPVDFQLTGIADFPFDDENQLTAGAAWNDVTAACGGGTDADAANILLVRSRESHGPDAAVRAIRRLRPDLHAFTNEEIVERMQTQNFSYFRQISTVLSAITLLFGFLLITVLMTVSVNQRVAEIAAMRALGFSRLRVAADVLCQSALLVGLGGLLALPLGTALSLWLDAILKKMPGIPEALHFFVFEPRALVMHASLLAATAVLAAVYPMRLVSTLPIAATLRNEVVS